MQCMQGGASQHDIRISQWTRERAFTPSSQSRIRIRAVVHHTSDCGTISGPQSINLLTYVNMYLYVFGPDASFSVVVCMR